MHPSWKEALGPEFKKPYFSKLVEFIREERKTKLVYPADADMFRAFETPLPAVRVVILGQDPYHNSGQAHGLSFSVPPGVRTPPSLQNIFKELKADLGIEPPKHGHLASWALRGVFLLNATLTVRAHEAGSHQGQGWETFTDAAISVLSNREEPMVFILWGKYARDKKGLISARHAIIESSHPSPMSASNGFFGSKPFSRANKSLASFGFSPIDWSL